MVPVTTVPAPRMVKTRSTPTRTRSRRRRRRQRLERAAQRLAQAIDPLARARRAVHDVGAPPRPEQLARLLAGEGREIRLHRVGLVHDDDGAVEAQQLAHRDVLAGLGHDPLVGRDDEHHELHARSARDHGAHQAPVTGDVHDAGVQAAQIERREAELDRDAALLLLGEAIGVDAGQRAHQGRLAVVDVAGGAYDEATHGG